MAFCARLSIVVLMVGMASLARAHSVLIVNESEGGGSPDTVQALGDIQQRLVNLETVLVKQQESIETQLKSLRLELSELTTGRVGGEEGRGVGEVARDIASAIRRGSFQRVEEKLVQLGDKAPISDIVREVYSGSECNIGILLNLTQSLTKPEPAFQILSALYDEMKGNGHKDVKSLVGLAKAFEYNVLEQDGKSKNLKPAVEKILKELRETITREASQIFITAMKTDKDYKYNDGVRMTGAALAGYRGEVAAAVMQRTVEGVFFSLNFPNILEAVNSHADLWQRITGMDALFEQIRAAEVVADDTVTHIAWYMSNILKETKYSSLDATMRDTADALVNELPTNVRNLFFLPTFCVYNKLQDSYLIASASLYDSERRNVLTAPRSKTGSVPTGSSWRVKIVDHKLIFDNVDYPDENIYAALYNYDKTTHYVFGWIPANNTDPQSGWTLKLESDGILLKNVHFNEFLYAADTENYLAGNKYAFTMQKKDAANKLGFLWQITEC